MKTKIVIKSVFGSILFEYEKENNTIKETLLEAIKCDAYLGGANLRGAKIKDKGILLIGNIGSRYDYTTIYNTDKGIYVKCGCFIGTIDKFVAKVKETHKGNEHERDYLAMVEFAKIKFSE